MSRITPRSAREWGAVLPVWLGILGLIGCFVVWTVTNRLSPVLVSAFLTLLGGGAGLNVLVELRQPPEPPIPPANPPEIEEHA